MDFNNKFYKYSPINCEKYHLRHDLSWMMLFSKNKGIAKLPFPGGCLAPYTLHYKLCYFILSLYLVIQDIENGGKDMSQTQMLKGILDGCLLAIINEKESYGYEMAERLSEYGFGTISEGTIYPILLRMQREGLVTSVRRESTAGPKRKYYSLTPKGQQELIDFLTRWEQLQKSVNAAIQKETEE